MRRLFFIRFLAILILVSQHLYAQEILIRDNDVFLNNESGAEINLIDVDSMGLLWYIAPPNMLVRSSGEEYDQYVYDSKNNDTFIDSSSLKFSDSGELVLFSPIKVSVFSDTHIFIYKYNSDFSDDIALRFNSAIYKDSTLWVGTNQGYVIKYTNKETKRIFIDANKEIKNGNHVVVNNINEDNLVTVRNKNSFYTIDTDTDERWVVSIENSPDHELDLNFHSNKKWYRDSNEDVFISFTPFDFSFPDIGHYKYKDHKYEFRYDTISNQVHAYFPFLDYIVLNPDRSPRLKSMFDILTISSSGNEIVMLKLIKKANDYYLEEVERVKFPNLIEDIAVWNDFVYISHLDKISKMTINRKKFKSFLKDLESNGSIANVSTRGFFQTDTTELLVASYNGIYKLNLLDEEKNTLLFPQLKIIWGFEKVNDSTLFAYGESNKNFFKIDLNTLNYQQIPNTTQEYIYSTTKVNDSIALLGSHNGIYKYNLYTNESVNISETTGLKDVRVNHIEMKDSLLNISTQNKGFLRLSLDADFKIINQETYLKDAIVYCSTYDELGNTWIGTDSGLYKFESNLIELMPDTENEKIVGLVYSKENLWFSSFSGLHKINEMGMFSYYLEDGLSSNEFNRASYLKLKNGEVIFGSINGLTKNTENTDTDKNEIPIIYPMSFGYSTEKEDLLEVNRKHYHNTELPHDTRDIYINYTITNSFNVDQNTYEYKIEGLSKDWVDNSNNTNVIFDKLPSGNYKLLIRGYDSRGIISANVLEYNFKILHPYYNTLAFKLSILLVTLLIFGWAIKLYYKKKKEELLRKNKILTFLANSTRSSMNPHFIFNSLNTIITGFNQNEMPDTLKNYIFNLSKLFRFTLDNSRDEFVSLENEIEYINAYAHYENTFLDPKVNLEITYDDKKADIKIPSLIIQPLIENAFKHAFTLSYKTNKRILLDIKLSSYGTLKIANITIKDNGIWKENSKGKKSYALKIIKERIAIWNNLNKTDIYNLKTRKNQSEAGWTEVQITVPYIKKKNKYLN